LTARDLLAAETPVRDVSVVEEAETFLVDLLAAEPLPANDVFAAAKQAGIAERTLKRAKKNAGIATKREGFGRGSYVLWSLPGHRGSNSTIEGLEESPAPNEDAGPLCITDPSLTPPSTSYADSPAQSPPRPIIRDDGSEEFLL
jgi:hypothetical protein